MRHDCVRLSIQTQFGQIGTDYTTASQSWKPAFVRWPKLGKAPAIQWTVSQSQQFQANSQNCSKIMVNPTIRQESVRRIYWLLIHPTFLLSTNFVNITPIRGRSWLITSQYHKTGWIALRSVWFHQNRALIAIQWQSITNTSLVSSWTSLCLPCGTQSSKIIHNPKSRQRKQRRDNRTRARITTDVQPV